MGHYNNTGIYGNFSKQGSIGNYGMRKIITTVMLVDIVTLVTMVTLVNKKALVTMGMRTINYGNVGRYSNTGIAMLICWRKYNIGSIVCFGNTNILDILTRLTMVQTMVTLYW